MINPTFPAFRPLLASTRGDWGSVGRQIENLTREHLIGIVISCECWQILWCCLYLLRLE